MKQFKNGECILISGGCHFNQFAFAKDVIVCDFPIDYDPDVLDDIRERYTSKISKVWFDTDGVAQVGIARRKCRMELYLKLTDMSFEEKVAYAWKIVEPLIRKKILVKPDKNTRKPNDKRRKPIIQLTRNGEFIAKFKSLTEASELTGVNIGNISSAVQHKNNYGAAGGYRWIYEKDYIKLHPSEYDY